jgi:hypothetical protein
VNEAVTSRQAAIESRLTVYMLLTFVGHLLHTGYLVGVLCLNIFSNHFVYQLKALIYVLDLQLPGPGLPPTTTTIVDQALCNQMAWVIREQKG